MYVTFGIHKHYTYTDVIIQNIRHSTEKDGVFIVCIIYQLLLTILRTIAILLKIHSGLNHLPVRSVMTLYLCLCKGSIIETSNMLRISK